MLGKPLNLSLTTKERERLECLRYRLKKPISKIIKALLGELFIQYDSLLRPDGLEVHTDESKRINRKNK